MLDLIDLTKIYPGATAPVVARLIDTLARFPRSGRSAVCFVALVGMLSSLLVLVALLLMVWKPGA